MTSEAATEVNGSQKGAGRNWMVSLLLLIIFGTFLVVAKHEVDLRLTRAGGVWSVEPSTLPDWFPEQFSGHLGSLRDIPSRVSLQSVHWQEEVKRELSTNPWISSIQSVERTADGIGFSGRFRRPSVGVRCQDGWLLADGSGRIIDRQPGDFLDPKWGIPEYIPVGVGAQQQQLAAATSGFILVGNQFEELFSLLSVLWTDKVFDRVPGFLHEISSTVEEGGARRWHLHTTAGIPLHWGRSPSSDAAAVTTSEQKLNCLRQVLELRHELTGSSDIPGISLYSGEEPLVVDGHQ